MPRKDQVAADAVAATLGGLDNAESAAYDATQGDTPVENMEWRPPSAFKNPSVPAGYKGSWIRTHTPSPGGTMEFDAKNVNAMFTQGWRPVLASEIQPGEFPPTIRDARFMNGQEIVGERDRIFCKLPLKMYRARNAYYAAKAQKQVAGVVGNNLRKETQGLKSKFWVAEENSRTELRKAPLDLADDQD